MKGTMTVKDLSSECETLRELIREVLELCADPSLLDLVYQILVSGK